MRYTGNLFLALSCALVLLGCVPNSPDTKAKIADTEKKLSDAEKATVEAAKARRDDYSREMHKRLDELDVKYEALKARAGKAEDQDKKELDKKVEEAKVKRDVAAKKLHELKEASHDRWEEVKDDVGHAFDNLKEVFD